MGVPRVSDRGLCKGMTVLTCFYLVILNDYPTSAESFHENHEDHGDINENTLRK